MTDAGGHVAEEVLPTLRDAEVDLTLGELGFLLDEGTSSTPVSLMKRLGLRPADAEMATNAVASLALRGLTRISPEGIFLAPPLVEARRIMLSAAGTTSVTVTSTEMVWAIVVFDGDAGRLSMTPSAIPTCRCLTKLSTREPVGLAISRAVASLTSAVADVAIVMEVQKERREASAAVRRQSGEIEVVSSVDASQPLSAADEALQEVLANLSSALGSTPVDGMNVALSER